MKLQEVKGFTMLEILVAGSIMLIVACIVLKMSIGILNTWERTTRKLNNGQDLKLALDVIERDLETSLPYYWSDGRRFSFYGFGKEEFPNAIVYEFGEDGLYRCIRNSGRKYNATIGLSEIPILLGSIKRDLIFKDVKELSVKFLHRNIQGKMEWAAKLPFNGTAVGAEIVVSDSKMEKLCRRIRLVGVSCL